MMICEEFKYLKIIATSESCRSFIVYFLIEDKINSIYFMCRFNIEFTPNSN